MSEEPKRRLVVKDPRSTSNTVVVSRTTNTSTLLENALKTLSEQLDKLALKSRVSTFDEKEARVLQGYIKSLVDLSKEERERDKADTLGDLAKLTDEELLELARTKLVQAKVPNT